MSEKLAVKVLVLVEVKVDVSVVDKVVAQL